MYSVNGKKAEKLETVTFSELNLFESDVEEILRSSIEMLCDEEESMLVVGRQVKNESNGRSDLTAIDNSGNIVLIEIKRDRKDIEARRESFEFQAIRYAASYATIESPDDLVKKVYAPYIEKYRNEFDIGGLTSYELGIRKLNEFLKFNESQNTFNEKQRIILAASDFDEQTLSAVAWLNSNNVDISCFKLIPYRINDQIFLDAEKILPVPEYVDYYVNLMDITVRDEPKRAKSITRRSLPKIDALLDWGVVHPGDVIVAKGREDEAILQANGNVLADGIEQSMQVWLKKLYGWSSVQTYLFAIQKETGKSLSLIRKEFMAKQTAGQTE